MRRNGHQLRPGPTQVICFLLLAMICATSAPAKAQHRAERLQSGESIILDAVLDEPVWHRVFANDRFVQTEPYTGNTAPFRTAVQATYDSNALYFAIRAYDPNPIAIRAPFVRYDKVFRDQDFIVVYVDAVGTLAAAQFFRVSASGGVADGVHTAATDNEDFSPDFEWQASARIVDDGYIVEMRLPYVALRHTHQSPKEWRVQIGRRMPREQAYFFMSVPLSPDSSSWISELAPLQGFVAPLQERQIQLRSSLTVRHETGQQSNNSDQALDLSLDLKWRPRADWIIDATLNPDFSQIELDVPQLSRTRQFAIFLPEKRPFFLEGTDLLQTTTDSLYTRSITDPRWGARATYRGQSLAGTLLTAVDSGRGLVLIPTPYSTSVVEQPASHTTIARLRWDLPNLSLGGIASHRQYHSGGVSHGYNQLVGPDIVWQIDRQQLVRTQVLLSATTAQVDDTSGQLVQSALARGHMANFEWQRNSSISSMSLRYREADEHFRNDNGFIPQNGFRQWRGSINRQFRPTSAVMGLNEITPYFEFMHASAVQNGDTIADEVHPGLYFTGPRGLDLTLQYRPRERTRLSNGGELHQYRQWYALLRATPSTTLSQVAIEGTVGERIDVIFDRTRPGRYVSLSGRLRLGSRFEIEPRYEEVRLSADNGRIAQLERVAQWLSVLHFSSSSSLRLIVQWTSFLVTSDAAPNASPINDKGLSGSLVYSYRHSSSTLVYLGAASASDRTTSSYARTGEVFAKFHIQLYP